MQTFEPLKTKYKELVSKDWFAKSATDEHIRRDISSLLILLQGVAIASRPNNSNILFGYLSAVLPGIIYSYFVYIMNTGVIYCKLFL